MIIASVLIGLSTAYYFGLQKGGIAAGASLLLFVIAFIYPPARLYSYALVAVMILGVLVIGPKQPGAAKRARLIEATKTLVKRSWRRFF